MTCRMRVGGALTPFGHLGIRGQIIVPILQRCTAAGTVLNPRPRITRVGDELRERAVLVKDA